MILCIRGRLNVPCLSSAARFVLGFYIGEHASIAKEFPGFNNIGMHLRAPSHQTTSPLTDPPRREGDNGLVQYEAALKVGTSKVAKHETSLFREVAMITKHGFKIRKQIKSEKLSRDVRYAVYLVYKLTQEQSKFEAPLKIVDYNIEYKYAPDCIYLLNPLDTPFIGKHLDQNNQNPINRPKLKAGVPLQRSDGWMEVELSEFKVTLNYSYIRLELMHRHHKDFSGLMIQGIEVRPI
ncbi:kinase-like domain, phloem protein 2-like protein [Tanacetum coccineum]